MDGGEEDVCRILVISANSPAPTKTAWLELAEPAELRETMGWCWLHLSTISTSANELRAKTAAAAAEAAAEAAAKILILIWDSPIFIYLLCCLSLSLSLSVCVCVSVCGLHGSFTLFSLPPPAAKTHTKMAECFIIQSLEWKPSLISRARQPHLFKSSFPGIELWSQRELPQSTKVVGLGRGRGRGSAIISRYLAKMLPRMKDCS